MDGNVEARQGIDSRMKTALAPAEFQRVPGFLEHQPLPGPPALANDPPLTRIVFLRKEIPMMHEARGGDVAVVPPIMQDDFIAKTEFAVAAETNHHVPVLDERKRRVE